MVPSKEMSGSITNGKQVREIIAVMNFQYVLTYSTKSTQPFGILLLTSEMINCVSPQR